MKRSFDFLSAVRSLPLCLCVFTLSHVGDNGEPIALALLLGIGAANLSMFLPSLTYFLSAFTTPQPTVAWVYLGQALLLLLAFLLRRKLFGQNTRGNLLLPFSAFVAGMLVYVFLANYTPYLLPFGVTALEDGFFQKSVIALALLLFAAICAIACVALKEKLLRCRMRAEETVFSLLIFVLCGLGFSRFFGVNAYMGIAFYILLLFCAAFQDAWGTVCAFVLSLPPFLVGKQSLAAFFLYGVVLIAFAKTGKLGSSLAFLICYFAIGYFEGAYSATASELTAWLLCALLPVLAFLLTPYAVIIRAENALIFYRERHLSRLALNRNRATVAKRLFEISVLFKEIQNTFLLLGNTDGETSAKAYMQNCVLNSVCRRCSGYGTCIDEGLLPSIDKMLSVGCIKGKVSLIDVPQSLARTCGRQSDLLYAMNHQLSEYRTYMQDAENAACGRQLLASQALGVSEIVGNLALEQSEPMNPYTQKERALEDALLKAGIVCSEILIYGSEEPTVSLVVFGESQVKKLAAVVTHLFGRPFCVTEKMTLAKGKFCCILRKKPPYDAIFGVACKTKDGETFSGDTHSVIRIDERRFLVALSDGMGSGEYAKQVSERTISLLESFYRAKMPPELTLSTINRLLSFSKEETFACVDIAVVDLDFGRADVVKIGAPTGFILSSSGVQILESESLPLGVLERIHPTTAAYPFKPEDTLVFLSDGITGAFTDGMELFDVVQTIPRSNPQNFVDTLLKIALDRYGGTAKDDMTALAVRILPSEPSP